MNLQSEQKDLLSYIDFELERLADHPPLTMIGEISDVLSLYYRTQAKCSILLDGNSDGFYHALKNSGDVRLYYLGRCNDQPGFVDRYMAASYGAAFFDLLAARDFDGAREIAMLSPGVWWEDYEYEDDFYFVHFFHRLLLGGQPSDDGLLDLVDRFEKALSGASSGKLDLCRALAERDQDTFDAAFESLLDEREEEIRRDEQRYFNDPIVFEMKRRIYTDGLAILNVADGLGLATGGEYRYCPALARLPMKSPFPEEKVIALP